MTPALTCDEYAALVRVTPATAAARCRAGRVPGAVRSGRAWLIPLSALPAPCRQTGTPETERQRAERGRRAAALI